MRMAKYLSIVVRQALQRPLSAQSRPRSQSWDSSPGQLAEIKAVEVSSQPKAVVDMECDAITAAMENLSVSFPKAVIKLSWCWIVTAAVNNNGSRAHSKVHRRTKAKSAVTANQL